MKGLSRRRALLGSLLIHVVVLVLLLGLDVHSVRARARSEQLAAAHAHEPALQRNSAEARAERLHRIRELAERLEGQGKGGANATKTLSVTPTPGSEQVPASIPGSASPSIPELHERARRDYEAARERLLDVEAKRLAKLTGQSVDSARTAVAAEHPAVAASRTGSGGGGGGVSADAQLETEIARMQGDAQGMLGRALELQRTDREGTQFSPEDARQAYGLANESQQLAEEARGFAPVVDWTKLMGGPLSTEPVNGVLDGGGADFRRVETQLERGLRTQFLSRASAVRFARRIGVKGTQHGEWVCPDAWYIIGPFENEHREAIDRSFPPEFEIDRDATYTGRHGQPVSWEFVRVRQLAVIPPHAAEYAIYYAFTEVYAAEPIDCWLALGSDDHSKLWVNGLLVWSDSRNQKNWSPTEGFRRVHLNAGFNRFLLRLENGWNGTVFSVALRLE
jgi:hypothetical protein